MYKFNPLTKTAKILALTGGAILLYTLVAKARTLGQLIFFPERLRALQWISGAPVITLGIMVQNTSNNSLTIQSFAGNVFVKDSGETTVIGNVSNFSPVAINGNSQGVMEVKIRLFALSVVNQLIQSIENGNFEMTLMMQANANVDNLQVPVEMSFKIGS